jgi:hypothetical protein
MVAEMKSPLVPPTATAHSDADATAIGRLHPAWQALIRYCREVGHGEIERIKIQDGLPVSVEVVKTKIRLV